MKKGLLIYPTGPTGRLNIGDYIQSIAAAQFIGTPDELIDRENLNSPRQDDIALIANGWYMHNPTHWPPDEKIHPLFVALHINKLAEKELLSPESIGFFKKHEPIGCRDHHTVDSLRAHGVDAYFSGCLTLTLGRTYKRDGSDGSVYFTDLSSRLPKNTSFKIKSFLNLISRYRFIRRIQKRKKECGISESLKSVAAFYTTYRKVISDDLFLTAIYKEQQFKDFFTSEKEKFEYADRLLKEYRNAKFVVTSRIHCALPCLAMETPVVFVQDENLSPVHNCRLNGLSELFHKIIISGNSINSEIGFISRDSSFENKGKHRKLAESLSSRCSDFVSACD